MYTCPMHPEVQSEVPGRCPKCSMTLVPVGEPPADLGLGRLTWRSWLPLAGVFAAIVAITWLWGWSTERFMAAFFIVFATFKLADLRGFADGYAQYDLIAAQYRPYGYLYPFVELAFGIAMAFGFIPTWLLWSEIVLLVFNGAGVVRKLLRHESVHCVCLGTRLKVPLTFVTLIEDFGMAALAVFLLSR